MKQIQKNHSSETRIGNYSRLITPFLLSLLLVTVSSCVAIGDIFKAGMGFGIFVVLAVLVIIVFIIMRFRK